MNLFRNNSRHDFLTCISSGIAASNRPFNIRASETLRRGLLVLVLIGFALALPVAASSPTEEKSLAERQAETKKVFDDRVAPFFKTYCTDCHGIYRMEGGINFAPTLTAPGVASSAKAWKQALANIKAHAMPPNDAEKQPTEEERQMFVDWMEMIKYLSPKDPGAFVIRRLTKMEYGNTLRDLFGVDPSVAADLPDEVFGEGYLNTLSPLQSEKYLGIANEVLNRILPSKDAPPNEMQNRLFGETPAPGEDLRAVAKTAARSLTRQAFRRPASEAELDVLLGVFDLAQANELDYRASLRLMLKAVLVSPQFLFITPAAEVTSGQTIAPLDDHQLASRLSYLLWATMPDAELSALADNGTLHEPAMLQTQVKRMLSDPRSRALFDGFGAQWLGLMGLENKTFDAAMFPQMTTEMRTSMVDEARLFFDSMIRENRSVIGFVDSDYTFLNETLATLYGLEKTVTGPEMRKVKIEDANRGGILGMPGVLAMTSFPNRTSPVKRGVWVLEQVLGERVPPAPPNVPPLDKQDKQAVENLTLRQRTELHRTNVVCANCHKILDPIGFGLENFDAIGRWRDKDDSGGPIDAAGELPGEKRFSNPRELKAIIAARKDELARNLTRKLLAYALCRQLEGYDEIVVDQLMAVIAKDGYRMQTLISEIVTSYPFVNRSIHEPEALTSNGQ